MLVTQDNSSNIYTTIIPILSEYKTTTQYYSLGYTRDDGVAYATLIPERNIIQYNRGSNMVYVYYR